MSLTVRDVAIVFHVHCLSPFRFLGDMLSRGPDPILWNAGISFPLERLYRLISQEIWTDSISADVWNKAYPDTPYQLWNSDPTSTEKSDLSLQSIGMTCSWCQKAGTVDLREFQTMYAGKGSCRCSSCGQEFNKESLPAQILKMDLRRFKDTKARWYGQL
jgi:hypothetical protein